MSFIPCITLANANTPITNLDTKGNVNGTFSTLTVSDYIDCLGVISATNQPSASALSINQGSGSAAEIVFRNSNLDPVGYVSFDPTRTSGTVYDLQLYNNQTPQAQVIVDGFGEIDASGSDIYVSSVTTTGIYLDAQVITANATELLLNGVPIATASNISSLADWSLYPVLPGGLNGGNANMSNINTIYAFAGNYASLTTSVLTVNTVVSQSTINNYSTINTLDIITDIVNTSTLTCGTANISTLDGTDLAFVTVAGQASFASTITLGDVVTGLLSVNGAGDLLYNGSTITAGGGGSASSWSAYPATQIVNMNTQGLSNAGAITAASVAASGNVAGLSNLVAGNNVYAGNAIEGLSILGSNSVGSLLDVSAGRDVLAANNIRATGTITANNTNNDTNTINGATTIYGGANGTLSFTTNAGLNGFRATTGVASIASAAAITLAAGGAISVAAGGACSVAGGTYVELNGSYIDCIGGSEIRVNSIQPQSGTLSIGATTIVNSGTIYTNVLSAPSIIPSLIGQTSSIVGVDLIANSNSFVAKNMSTINLDVNTINGSAYPPAVAQSQFISSLSVSTINGQETTAYFTQPKIETTFFSTLGATLVVSNDVATDTLEVSTINGIPIANYLLNDALANRLQIVDVGTPYASTITYVGGVGTPSAWIPDSNTYQPTAGTNNGWRNFKQVGTSGTSTQAQWWLYNPYYGSSIPYIVNPNPTIQKKDLNSVWAVITSVNRINTQGIFFFNIYGYDINSPPAGTYNQRWDYTIYNFPTMYGAPVTTATSLAAGYRYLVCAVDTPKNVAQTTATLNINVTQPTVGVRYTIATVGNTNWTSIGAPVAVTGCVFTYNGVTATGSGTCTYDINTSILVGNGVTSTQTTFLREPYNIHTDMPHITLNAVANATPSSVANPENLVISGIVFGTTSSAITPTLDITVEKLGFTANGGTVNYEYTMQYN